MLYLDYSQPAGEWIPNKYGGRENLEAIDFLRRFNIELFGHFPDATTAAEESTAWPQVSRPVEYGGLGFGFKKEKGWVGETLELINKEPAPPKQHPHGSLFRPHHPLFKKVNPPLASG